MVVIDPSSNLAVANNLDSILHVLLKNMHFFQAQIIRRFTSPLPINQHFKYKNPPIKFKILLTHYPYENIFIYLVSTSIKVQCNCHMQLTIYNSTHNLLHIYLISVRRLLFTSFSFFNSLCILCMHYHTSTNH